MKRMLGQQLPLRRHRNDQHDILQVSHADYVDHSLCGQSGSNDHTASLIRVMEHRHSTHPGTSNNLHACASDPTCSYLAYSAHHAKAIAFHGFPREHNFGKLASFTKSSWTIHHHLRSQQERIRLVHYDNGIPLFWTSWMTNIRDDDYYATEKFQEQKIQKTRWLSSTKLGEGEEPMAPRPLHWWS